MSHGEHINTMLPCRQTSSILANKLRYLNLDDARSTSKGLRVLCEKVDFHRTGAYHHHNNRFWCDKGFVPNLYRERRFTSTYLASRLPPITKVIGRLPGGLNFGYIPFMPSGDGLCYRTVHTKAPGAPITFPILSETYQFPRQERGITRPCSTKGPKIS